MGGLPPDSTGRETGFLIWEAAMCLYEILDLAFRAIKFVYDVLSTFLRRRKKRKRVKK